MIMLEEGNPTEILITKGFSIQWKVRRRCHFDSPKKRTGKGKNIVIEETKNLSGIENLGERIHFPKRGVYLWRRRKSRRHIHIHLVLGRGES